MDESQKPGILQKSSEDVSRPTEAEVVVLIFKFRFYCFSLSYPGREDVAPEDRLRPRPTSSAAHVTAVKPFLRFN